MRTLVVGGGCFWCLEAIYQQIKGVHKIVSGYAGGNIKNPTYKEICSGLTKHAEVIEITYDENEIDVKGLLNVFWHIHDPTTPNRQGNDVGPQYRSIILYQNEQEKSIAEASMNAIGETTLWVNPIVTEIAPLDEFYAAESYHQNYYNDNKTKNPYCSIVIGPKIAKFKKEFSHLLTNAAS